MWDSLDASFLPLDYTTRTIFWETTCSEVESVGPSRFQSTKSQLSQFADQSKAIRLKLGKLWTSRQELCHSWKLYLGRIRKWDKRWLEQALDLQFLQPHKNEGELDILLRTAEAYIKKQQNRRFYFSLVKLESYSKELSRLNGPLDDQHRKVELELEQLQSLNDQLDEEERRQHNAYMDRMKRFLRLFTMSLERLLEALFFCNFSEFPNRYRPPCTTMPWNIWPVLVVLWGVCWMFYSRSTTPQPDESQEVLEAWPPITSDDSLYYTYDSTQFQHSPHPFNQQSDWSPETLDALFQQTPGFETSAIAAASNAWLPPPSEGRGDFEQVETGNVSAYQTLQGLEHTTVQPLLPVVSNIQSGSNGYEVVVPYHDNRTCIIQQSPNHLLVSSSQYLAQSEFLSTPPITQAAHNPIGQTMGLSQKSTNIGQPMQPPRNSGGRMICDRDGCNNITFYRRSAWQTHINKHDRPYTCPVAGCTHLKGFSSKGDLERHQRTKHKQLPPHVNLTEPSNLLYYCPDLSCDRSSSSSINKPFTRKDNRQEHIKRKHEYLLEHSPSMPKGCNLTASPQHYLNSNLSGLESSANLMQAAVAGTGKRRRLEKSRLPLENANSANEELHRLQEDSEELRRKVRDLELELELSKKREETLFEVISKCTKQPN